MEETPLTIQTDDGRLHPDECAAITLLSNYYSRKNIPITIHRSKEPDYSNILIGIGGKYDAEHMHFDHHQNTFIEKWPSSDVVLSSAGLVWRHYGKKIVEMYLTSNPDEYDFSENYTHETIEEIVNIIYFNLILSIDANENGVENASKLNICNLINDINADDSDEKQKFEKAIMLLSQIFDIKFKKIINSYFNFPKDLESLKKYNLSNPYLVINEKIPTVFKCLKKLDPNCSIKFLIFGNSEEYNFQTKSEYRSQRDYNFPKDMETRPQGDYTIKTRLNEQSNPLVPIASEEILRKRISNPDEVTYLHKSLFSAKTKTLPTAIEIVIYSLENYKNIINCQIEEASKKMEAPLIDKSSKVSSNKISYTHVLLGSTFVLSIIGVTYYFLHEQDLQK